MKTVKITITGKVIGVFFRANTKKNADRLGIKGYVHNLQNGNLEVIARGDESQLKQMADFCKKGTALSKVESIKVDEMHTEEIFTEFDIRY